MLKLLKFLGVTSPVKWAQISAYFALGCMKYEHKQGSPNFRLCLKNSNYSVASF
jgi:hypothetical protein